MTQSEEKEFLRKAMNFVSKNGQTMSTPSIHALAKYVYERVPPGGFLQAVLINDLISAVAQADEENIEKIPAYIEFVYNHIPHAAWGTPKKVNDWIINKED